MQKLIQKAGIFSSFILTINLHAAEAADLPAPPPPTMTPQVAGESANPNNVTGSTPADGPRAAERMQLWQKILEAGKQGVGIAPYLAAFARIEQSVNDGASNDEIGKKVDSLQANLSDQMKRIEDIKSRPSFGIQGRSAFQMPNNSEPPMAGSFANGLGQGQIMEQLRQRFGDRINDPAIKERLMQAPPGQIEALKQRFGDQMPGALNDPNIREKLLQSENGRQILEKLGQ